MSKIVVDPRKRPRQRRSEATVDAILEAAARILESDGLDALTTNAVADRAGVSVGSLYQYFPGKTALLAELIRRERGALVRCQTGVEP
jgi:AcrR family transcriptional regulator